MKFRLRTVTSLIIFLSAQTSAFAISIGGPRGFDFGTDGNLYFSQGPTSAFPHEADSFEGIALLSSSGIFSKYAELSIGASTAPIMSDDCSFYVGSAGGLSQVRYYSSDGSLQSSFWLTSSVVNPSIMNQIDDLVEGPNHNLYLYVHVNGKGLIQEYTNSGNLVRESSLLDWANPAYLSFSPDGTLYASDRYGVTVRVFDENLNITASQTFSQVNDLRDFYIDMDGNYLFTSKTPNEISGTFSKYNPLTDIWNHNSIELGVPLEIIQIPDGTDFLTGNYLVGFVGELPHYGSILEFDSSMNLVATYSAEEPVSPPVVPIPEPTTIALMIFGLLGLLGIGVKRRRKKK